VEQGVRTAASSNQENVHMNFLEIKLLISCIIL